MINKLKEILTKKFGISEEVNWIDMSYKEKKVEEDYIKSILDKEFTNSINFFFFFSILFIILILFSIFIQNFASILLLLIGYIIEIFLTIAIKISKKNFYRIRILNYFRFLSFYIFLAINTCLL